MREYKAIISTNIKAESNGRVRTGIAAVFGNVDAAKDRTMPGSFLRTINNNGRRVKHLWNHDSSKLPIAKIIELREVGKNELPDDVLEHAPDATGGLLVKREYFKNSVDAEHTLEAIDAGVINEMSFAYDVVRSQKAQYKNADGEEMEVRELLELALYDTSDVNWGCNSATVAIGAKNHLGPYADLTGRELPIGVIAAQLRDIASAVKSGRLEVTENTELLEFIHDTAKELGAVCNSDHKNLPAEEEPAPVISDDTALLLKRNRAAINELSLYIAEVG